MRSGMQRLPCALGAGVAAFCFGASAAEPPLHLILEVSSVSAPVDPSRWGECRLQGTIRHVLGGSGIEPGAAVAFGFPCATGSPRTCDHQAPSLADLRDTRFVEGAFTLADGQLRHLAAWDWRLYEAGQSPPLASPVATPLMPILQAPPALVEAAETCEPVLSGEYRLVAERRASGVAGPLSEGRLPAGAKASFGSKLAWFDGAECADWVALPTLPTQAPPDPILSDLAIGPHPGPNSAGDRRLDHQLQILCGGRKIARITAVDRRVIVTESADGTRHQILERPLAANELKRFQEQLADMHFLHGEPSGSLDAATIEAAAAYAQYRGAAYRFSPPALTENLLDGLGVLQASSDTGRALGGTQARLGFRLLELMEASQEPSGNVTASPASLAAAVAYLHLGADAAMQATLLKTLGLDDAAQMEALRRTARTLSEAPDGAPLTFANALFFDPAFPIYPAAREKLAAAGMASEPAELTTDAGVEQVNAWVKESTRELIDGILSEPLPAPGIAAVNALHFKDSWLEPFNPARTAAFHLAGGGRVDAPIMSLRDHRIGCRQEGRFAAARLPYKTDGLSFVVVTTSDEPAALAEFAPAASWMMDVAASDGDGSCVVAMPKLSVETKADLMPVLKQLGFVQESASAFEGLSAAPLVITQALQRTVMKLDEIGTEAAAATAITGVFGSALQTGIEVRADKPFLFALIDERHDLVLLAGYVANPIAEAAD